MSHTHSHAKTLRKSAFTASLFSLLPHIVCCLMPTAAALVSLGTTVGLGAALSANPLYRLVDGYHFYFLGLAVFTVILSGLINFVSWRIDCHNHSKLNAEGCHHEPCEPKKSGAFRIFLFSVALLAFDIGYYLFEEDILGLHHHFQ
ncbi:MAG TPA: hypothetical protein VHP58_00480 [Alphaproteobacteria bacterium]|nr:hypothetical protein [Alphaproteobacteria bacterium]